MFRKLTPVIALTAGLLGGLLSRYIAPAPVHAQAPAPAPTEIQAQSFTLVDATGAVVGTFRPMLTPWRALGRSRAEGVELVDPSGQVIWRAGGTLVRPLSQ
jgi:hypothetical protein